MIMHEKVYYHYNFLPVCNAWAFFLSVYIYVYIYICMYIYIYIHQKKYPYVITGKCYFVFVIVIRFSQGKIHCGNLIVYFFRKIISCNQESVFYLKLACEFSQKISYTTHFILLIGNKLKIQLKHGSVFPKANKLKNLLKYG